jgi:hypothetical protein
MNEQLPPISFTIPQGMFNRLNRAVSRQYGSDLPALAEISPNQAYEAYGSTIIGVILKGHPQTLDYQSGMSVDARMDSVQAQKSFTEILIKDSIAPKIEYEPRDVVISVIKRRTLIDILKQRKAKIEVALAFTVFPN